MKPDFEQPGVQLYLGDCLRVLPTLPDGSVDAVVTDPPYTSAGGSTNGRSGGHAADTQFFLFWLRAVWSELRRVLSPSGCGFVFCDWRTCGLVAEAVPPRVDSQRSALWKATQALVWDREGIGLGTPFRNSYEMIVFARGPEWESSLPKNIPNLIRHPWSYTNRGLHGAEKPVALCERLVRWACPEGGTVLDPFLGGGTTGLAALSTGRRFIGVEIDPHYFGVARKRLSECDGPLFAPQPSLFPDETRLSKSTVAPSA
jgi:site-specific DNA-methyltransferase (adenine-specific)